MRALRRVSAGVADGLAPRERADASSASNSSPSASSITSHWASVADLHRLAQRPALDGEAHPRPPDPAPTAGPPPRRAARPTRPASGCRCASGGPSTARSAARPRWRRGRPTSRPPCGRRRGTRAAGRPAATCRPSDHRAARGCAARRRAACPRGAAAPRLASSAVASAKPVGLRSRGCARSWPTAPLRARVADGGGVDLAPAEPDGGHHRLGIEDAESGGDDLAGHLTHDRAAAREVGRPVRELHAARERAGAGREAERGIGGVALGREVHLAGHGLQRHGQLSCRQNRATGSQLPPYAGALPLTS